MAGLLCDALKLNLDDPPWEISAKYAWAERELNLNTCMQYVGVCMWATFLTLNSGLQCVQLLSHKHVCKESYEITPSK